MLSLTNGHVYDDRGSPRFCTRGEPLSFTPLLSLKRRYECDKRRYECDKRRYVCDPNGMPFGRSLVLLLVAAVKSTRTLKASATPGCRCTNH
jgi:hypothetical protein